MKETLRVVSSQLRYDTKSEIGANNASHLMVFLIHDNEHKEMTRQVMIACRQAAIDAPPIPHWVLPKFSKTEMTKIFGVKRLTCFTLDFSKMSDASKVQEARDGIETMLKEYINDPAEKPDLTKFRYADDSMF